MTHPKFDLSTTVLDTIREPGPARPVASHAPEPADSAVGMAEILAHLIMAGIIYYAMWRSVADVRMALVAAVLYFGSATTLRILARTHTLADAWHYWLEYRLERHRIDTLAELSHRHMDLLETERAPALPALAELPPRTPAASSYVAPVDETDRALALAWAESLYTASGYLDPRQVDANGRLKGRVIGSKRDKAGTVGAQQFLVSKGFLAVREHSAYINVRRFPTRLDLAQLHPPA